MKSILLFFALFLCCPLLAAEYRVGNATELIARLTELYNSGTQGNTVYLEKGEYDVSSAAMGYYNVNGYKVASGSHISAYCTRLVGMGESARDVVIYGNFSNRILICTGAGGIDNLTISNGCISAVGGGVWAITCAGSTPSSTGVVVTCCKSIGQNGGGVNGGVWTRSHFLGNQAQHGGGCASVACYDCTIAGNVAWDRGGGVYYKSNLYRCRIIGNSASSGGGVAGSASDTMCHVYGGEIRDNQASNYGGGLYWTDCREKAVVIGNRAKRQGGGIWSGTGTIADSIVASNIVDGTGGQYDALGGGIFNNSGGCEVVGTEIVFNSIKNDASSKNSFGGGVYGGSCSNCLIAGNALFAGANNVQGGGAYGSTLTKCTVRDNYAEGLGAAMNGGAANACKIFNNPIRGNNGHSIRQVSCLSDCEINGTIDGAVLLRCRVCDYTNGYYLASGANIATNGWFQGSHYLLSGASCATNCLFAGNDLVRHNSWGALFYKNAASASWKVVNCTIADNRFLNTVSFDMGYTGGVEFRNCIFARNRDASGYWRNMTFYEAHAGYISIVGNVIGPGRHVPGNSTGTIAITDAEENGLFIGGDDEHPYALSRKSKALNAGMAEEWMRSATDIRNDSRYARLRDGEIDAGCYQYWRFSSGMSIVFR